MGKPLKLKRMKGGHVSQTQKGKGKEIKQPKRKK